MLIAKRVTFIPPISPTLISHLLFSTLAPPAFCVPTSNKGTTSLGYAHSSHQPLSATSVTHCNSSEACSITFSSFTTSQLQPLLHPYSSIPTPICTATNTKHASISLPHTSSTMAYSSVPDQSFSAACPFTIPSHQLSNCTRTSSHPITILTESSVSLVLTSTSVPLSSVSVSSASQAFSPPIPHNVTNRSQQCIPQSHSHPAVVAIYPKHLKSQPSQNAKLEASTGSQLQKAHDIKRTTLVNTETSKDGCEESHKEVTMVSRNQKESEKPALSQVPNVSNLIPLENSIAEENRDIKNFKLTIQIHCLKDMTLTLRQGYHLR